MLLEFLLFSAFYLDRIFLNSSLVQNQTDIPQYVHTTYAVKYGRKYTPIKQKLKLYIPHKSLILLSKDYTPSSAVLYLKMGLGERRVVFKCTNK